MSHTRLEKVTRLVQLVGNIFNWSQAFSVTRQKNLISSNFPDETHMQPISINFLCCVKTAVVAMLSHEIAIITSLFSGQLIVHDFPQGFLEQGKYWKLSFEVQAPARISYCTGGANGAGGAGKEGRYSSHNGRVSDDRSICIRRLDPIP